MSFCGADRFRINLQSIMKAALLKVEAFRTISQAGGAESSIEAIISDAQDVSMIWSSTWRFLSIVISCNGL